VRLRIESAYGAVVEIRPLRYQFPDRPGDGSGQDWDANWLVVRGDCRATDGRCWSFEDPCLTTWEARQLADWLVKVASGAESPSPFDAGDDERLLAFTEPNLAFSLQARDSTSVTVRVHFSLEALPPWEQRDERADLFEFYLPMRLTLDDVARAANDWRRELAAFPER
jgi:hypothetical protein